MALSHATSGEIVDLRAFGADLPSRCTSALLKGRQLELIRIVLPAGRTAPMHAVPGEITVLCLEGEVDFQAHGRTQRLRAGELVWLEGGVAHSLLAVSDASLLVTIRLENG